MLFWRLNYSCYCIPTYVRDTITINTGSIVYIYYTQSAETSFITCSFSRFNLISYKRGCWANAAIFFRCHLICRKLLFATPWKPGQAAGEGGILAWFLTLCLADEASQPSGTDSVRGDTCFTVFPIALRFQTRIKQVSSFLFDILDGSRLVCLRMHESFFCMCWIVSEYIWINEIQYNYIRHAEFVLFEQLSLFQIAWIDK